MSFSLTDVHVGATVMCGTDTTGHTVVGLVDAVLPGIGFRVRDVDGVATVLWKDLMLVAEDVVFPPSTGVGVADVGYGYPDCAFWDANGIEPLFVATPYDYGASAIPPAPGSLLVLLMETRDKVEKIGGVYLRAWSRQLSESLSFMPRRFPEVTPRTPDRPLSVSPVLCPGAPERAVPPLPDDEEDTEEDQAEEQEDQEEAEEEVEEEAEEEVEEEAEEEEDAQEEPVEEPKNINLLTSPNTVPIVVLAGWVMYLGILTFQNYCSCRC